MSNVNFTRPEVKEAGEKWTLIEACIKGQRAIKKAGTKFLPSPCTELIDTRDKKRYADYLLRAVFYNVTGRTKKGLLGQAFDEEPKVELADILEPMLADVDGAGVGLVQQSKRATSEVLVKARCGLLSEFDNTGEEVSIAAIRNGAIKPRIILFKAENIINWQTTAIKGKVLLSLLVLKEKVESSEDQFEICVEDRWRVFELVDSVVYVTVYKKVEDKDEYIIAQPKMTLKTFDSLPFTEIPFSFIGSDNNDSEIDDPVLYDLAELNVAHYRNSADYEESCFLVGQPTPVITGLTQKWVKDNNNMTLGSRNGLPLPVGATAFLLQAQPNVMPFEAMTHKEIQMKAIGAKLIEPGQVQKTATESNQEHKAEACVLSNIVDNVSSAYVRALGLCLSFIASPEDSVFEINKNFTSSGMTTEERKVFMSELQGGGITWSEYRAGLRRIGVATIEDELARDIIEAEAPSIVQLSNNGNF